MKYAVLHVQKGTGNGGAIGRHIDRIGPQKNNIDPERTSKNFKLRHENGSYYVTQPGVSLATKINKRILEGKTDGKTIRKDAVKYLSFLLSTSHDSLVGDRNNPNFKQWVISNFYFMGKKFGYENIVDFTVHLDERTPHIHVTVVPITRDGRLSAKEVVGDKKNLTSLQTEYAESMAKFGLQRGHHYQPGENVPRHTSVNEFYEILEKPDKKLVLQIHNNLKADFEALITDFKEIKAKRIAEAQKSEIEQKKRKKRGFRF